MAQVVLAFPSVRLTHPDLIALDTLAKVLGEGRGSRLDLAVREPGLAHAVSAWNYTPRDPGLFGVALRLDPDKIPQALEAVWAALERMQRELVTAGELEAARRGVMAQYLFGRQTVAAQAADLAGSEALTGDPEFSWHYVQGVQQVDAEALRRVAQTYLWRDRVTQVVVRPRGTGAAETPAAIFRATRATEPPVSLVTLSNGIRVLLREDPRLPIVTLRVTAIGGTLYETPATNGLSALMSRMFLRGTALRSAQEITDLVRSLGGDLASTSGRNSIGVSLSLLSRDVSTGVELLSDVWHHPAFPADEFLKEQRLLLAERLLIFPT